MTRTVESTLSNPIRLALPSPVQARVVSTDRTFADQFGRHDRDGVAVGLRQVLGLNESDPVIFGRQVHAARCVEVNGEEAPALETGHRTEFDACDALATDQLRTTLVVRTADCVPVVFSAASVPWVAVVHAGWRGTYESIVQKTIDLALRRGIDSIDLHCWIGPHIQGDTYEVSPELIAKFRDRFGKLGIFSHDRLLDLGRLNTLQAMECGVPEAQIHSCGLCTYSMPDRFPSYRRDGECRGQIYTAVVLGDDFIHDV